MNHFLLPASSEGHPATDALADVATKTLLDKLRALGCRVPYLQAKYFRRLVHVPETESYDREPGHAERGPPRLN